MQRTLKQETAPPPARPPRAQQRAFGRFRRLNNAGVLEPYIEHGEQAHRSNGRPIACFDRQVVRDAD